MDRNNAVQVVVVIMHVALRKESVDRNNTQVSKVKKGQGRSPQGERG